MARDAALIVLSAAVALAVAYGVSELRAEKHERALRAVERRAAERLDRLQAHLDALSAQGPRDPLGGRDGDVAVLPRQAEHAIVAAEPLQAANAAEAADDAEPVNPNAQLEAASDGHPLLGAWRCAFRQQEYAYPPMACHIRRKDGGFYLEKTQGSQRIKGAIALQGDDRFTFTGLYFCPWGACDEQTSGTFERKSRDHWVGKLNDGGYGTEVTLRRSTAGDRAETAKPRAVNAQPSAPE